MAAYRKQRQEAMEQTEGPGSKEGEERVQGAVARMVGEAEIASREALAAALKLLEVRCVDAVR